MKTSNSMTKVKAFSGSAALITAAVFTLALLFTGCNHDIASDTVSITFNVDGANGTLKAKADGIAETDTSPVSVKKGKIVTFTAKADKGCRVKKWMLNGDPITEAGKNTEYKLTVSNAVTVSVSFEPIPPGEAQLKLGPIKRDIKIKAVTFDGSDIQVSYCDEGTLKNNVETVLNATSTTITLTGKITELYCSENELTQLDVRDLAALQKLDCSENQLKFLYVQGLSDLQEIDCTSNQLDELYVSGLTSLKELSCSKNELGSLNLSGLIALQSLDCYRNKLTEVKMQGCSALKALNCSENQLAALDISSLSAFKHLSCYNNKLKAQAMTELLKALPSRKASDYAKATLYTEKTEPVEDNCKDYNTPAELKTAFESAMGRHWKLQKEKPDGTEVDI